MNNQTKDISVQAVLPHPPHVVWKTLTVSELIAQWLMPNDFELSIGKKFNFRTKPMGDWDGVVYCEILEIIENRRLVYSWKGGAGAGRLDTILTWTLTPVEAGTRLEMVHAGFRLPGNQNALDAMTPGWGRVMERIEGLARQISNAA